MTLDTDQFNTGAGLGDSGRRWMYLTCAMHARACTDISIGDSAAARVFMYGPVPMTSPDLRVHGNHLACRCS